MSKNKHKFLTFAALMTGATVAVHFINHTIATAAQFKNRCSTVLMTITLNGALGTFIIPKKGTGSPIF